MAATTASTPAAQRRIARLASLTAVHRAFHWLHLHQPQLRQWQLDLVRIPAPPFNESARAAWVLDRFQQLGLTNVHTDEAGNVLGELSPDRDEDDRDKGRGIRDQGSTIRDQGSAIREQGLGIRDQRSGIRDQGILRHVIPTGSPERSRTDGVERSLYSANAANNSPTAKNEAEPQNPDPCSLIPVPSSLIPDPSSLFPDPCSLFPVILISAHLDTVFPAGTNCEPIEPPDTARIYAPGICDNVAGLSGLLAIAAALRYANIAPPIPILFSANVGEEGEGDLRGMRHLFERSPYADRIAAAIVLEGSGSSAVVTRALGSLRFRITATGPGGHSWSDAGVPNPILILSRLLLKIADIELPTDPLTTVNVGSISGGTSINSIPETATALIDLRSTDPVQLAATAARIHEITAGLLTTFTAQNTTTKPSKLHIETIGNRPAATLPADSPILHTLRAVDRHLTLRTELRIGSTDANIPLSIGIPAIAIGAGGLGGGIHTLQEWYDPTGRENALRRILLTLLDTTQTTADNHNLNAET